MEMAAATRELAAEYEEAGNEVCCSAFPPDFVFGVATSAYQVEGACKEGNKGPSIWDAFSHTDGKIIDGSNGDIAMDQYHRYKEDVELIAKLGFDAYRFSISWLRIFPDGLGIKVNKDGIAYYNNIINALLDKGIKPYVTLYHWDLPLYIRDRTYFSLHADTCFASFGDKVKNWITINEPLQTSVNGYGLGIFAPGRHELESTEPCLVAHHQLLAHAAAVSIYRSKYKVLDPKYSGGYPKVMSEQLGDRLPIFSEEEKNLLNKSLDFVGLNHYTSRLIAHVGESPEDGDFYEAQKMERIDKWEGGQIIGEKAASEWLYVVPWGIHKVLNYIAQRYENPPIYITENGMDDEDNDSFPLHECLDDRELVTLRDTLQQLEKAMKDGADVRGYFAWSLLESFVKRFGLVYIDYKNGLSRHPKSSAYWFSRFLKGMKGKMARRTNNFSSMPNLYVTFIADFLRKMNPLKY